MASVTFSVSVGGDGSTVTDDSNTSTGLANGGHRTRFVPALAQVVAVASNTVTQATSALASANSASASAATALTAPGTSATSASSLTIGTGSQSLTLAQTGKSFAVGQWVSISSSASPGTQWMLGAITAFTSGTGAMTVSVQAAGGSGTLSSWVVAAATPPAVTYASAITVLSVVSGTTQAAVKDTHYVLTNVAASTLTLPATPTAGDTVWVTAGNGLTTNVIARNGQNIMGLAEDMTLDDANVTVQLRYINATLGWRLL